MGIYALILSYFDPTRDDIWAAFINLETSANESYGVMGLPKIGWADGQMGRQTERWADGSKVIRVDYPNWKLKCRIK